MRLFNLLTVLVLTTLAACDSASDPFGPSTSTATAARKTAQAGDSGSAVAGTATRADSAQAAVPALKLAGRAVARCETARAPRIFVSDTSALAAPISPAVARVLAARIRLKVPVLLELGSRCATGS